MPEASWSLAFLSLFTTEDRAASIIGDLLEESGKRRRIWYTLQVAAIAVALFFKGIRSAPARSLGLGLMALIAWICVFAALLVASGLPWYPWNRTNEPEFWIRMILFLGSANLSAGFIVGRWVSIGGASGIGPLVAIVLSVPLIVPMAVSLPATWELWLGYGLRLLVVGLFYWALYAMPLLAGATIARRLEYRKKAIN